jgi:hypothetical protein
VSVCEFVTPAWRPLVGRAPQHAAVVRLCCRASKEDARCGGLKSDLAILSERCEVESRMPSVWPASMAWTRGGRRLAKVVRRKSSGTSGARTLRCRRKRNGPGRQFPHVRFVSRAVRVRWTTAHQLCFKPVKGLVLR